MVCNRKKNKVTKTTCTYFGDKSQKFAPTAKKTVIRYTEKVFTFRFKYTLYFQIKMHKIDFVRPTACAEFSAHGQVSAEV